MNPIRHTLLRLVRDENGATIVEFAMVVLPLCLIIVAGLDFGHRMYVSSVLQGSLTDSARIASVENPNLSPSVGSLEKQVEDAVERQVRSLLPSGYKLEVDQSNFYDFAGIGNPEKIIQDFDGDGVYDEADGDCFEDLNENGQFDTDTGRAGRGGANDVVFYQATLEMDALVPLANFLGGETRYTLIAETAVRNQPWSTQATPPTLCGTPSP